MFSPALAIRYILTVIYILKVLNNLRNVKENETNQVGEDMENFPNFYIHSTTTDLQKHLGFGKAVLYNASARARLNAPQRESRKKRMASRMDSRIVISICLLLSGDIHPCPGPGSLVNSFSTESNPTDRAWTNTVTGASGANANNNANATLGAGNVNKALRSPHPQWRRHEGLQRPASSDTTTAIPSPWNQRGSTPLLPRGGSPRTPASTRYRPQATGPRTTTTPSSWKPTSTTARSTMAPRNRPAIKFNSTTENKGDIFPAALHNETVESETSSFSPKDIDQIFSGRGLHILHMNVCSLIRNIDQIRLMFGNGKVGILSFSETRLDNSIEDSEIEIANYTVIRNDRNRHGGGVCTYVRTDICFNVRNDLDQNDIEAVWLDIIFPKTKPLLIGCLYRPPSQNSFYEQLNEGSADLGNTEVILIGDLNTNILKKDTSIYKSFSNYCKLHSLKQLITQFTRVCPATQTVIDLILTSDQTKISRSGVIECGISDHNIIFCTRKIQKSVSNCHNTIRFRSLKKYTSEALTAALEKLDWSNVLNCSSVEKAWASFKSNFLHVIDELAPLKVARVKSRTEPWVNTDIIEAIKLRNDRHSKFNKNRNEQLSKEYKNQRNEVTRMIRKAKNSYYNEKIAENKNNPAKLWKTLKDLGHSCLKTITTNLNMKINGSLITDALNVANCLNTFFSTIATTLVNKLPSHSGLYGEQHIQAFYKNKGVRKDDFKFVEVKTEEVIKKLSSLQPNKATGHDNIPTRFLKDAAVTIAPMVAHITNLSISQCHVPQEFKLARITPLYKKGNKLDPGNYRPVSILCSISKVIERLIYEQIDNYLSNHELLFEFQSGFRKSHSTDTCLLYLTDYIRREVDMGKYCGMVMLDLQKAFDTVNHSILLNKLRAIGFDSAATNWMKSYLEDREQVVEVNGSLSSPLKVNCGVPQGSILGPLLFLIYINDMKSACNGNLFLFADDSAILASDRDKIAG